MNGENRQWEFRSHHPKNGRGRRTMDEDDWDMTLNSYKTPG